MTFGRVYWLSVTITLAAAIVLSLAGFFLISASQGTNAGLTVVAGCLVSWLAGCIASIPLALGFSKGPQKQAEAILAATAVRFLGVLFLVVPVTLSGWFDRVTFVASVAVSYMILLLVDTVVVVGILRRST